MISGVSVVHFMSGLNQQCLQISPFVDALCTRYPSVNFLKVVAPEIFPRNSVIFAGSSASKKNSFAETRTPLVLVEQVDVDESPDVASSESVRIVPTFKIYKQGTRVKEMIFPSRQVLEYSVRHYGI